MLFILAYLISFTSSSYTQDGTTLTISDEATLTKNSLSQYSSCTTIKIQSSSAVSIESQAFWSFIKIESMTIDVQTINFNQQSFMQQSQFKALKVTADTINVNTNSFQSAAVESIEFKATTKILISLQGFQSLMKVSTLTLNCDGTIEIGENAFQSSFVKVININAGGDVSIGLQSFQSCDYITNLVIESKNAGITFAQSSFLDSTLGEVSLTAKNDIILGQSSMQQVKDFSKLTVITQGNFKASFESFLHSKITEFYIKCNGVATFDKQTFQQTPSLNSFTVIANKGITFDFESFLQSKVNSMYLKTDGAVTFANQAFQETKNLNKFTIEAGGSVQFNFESFLESTVNTIDITAGGMVNFSQQSFQNCKSLNTLDIDTDSDVYFGYQSFLGSQIHSLDVDYNSDSKNAILLATKSVTFSPESFMQCNELQTVKVNTKGNVNIQKRSFEKSASLNNVNIKADGKATVESHAFSGCSSLDKANIDASETDISKDAYSDEDNKGGSSSGKDDDSKDEVSARTLGNIKIKSVYLGTSPNIYVNLNVFLSMMRKARKTLGHIVPSPDFIHSAIWVCEDEEITDESVGAIFVYGKYYNKYKMNTYLADNGAKAYILKFKEFKKKYPSIDPMKLNAGRKLKLFDFINEIEKSGNWGVYDYNWPTNNCQHFTAKLIQILEATRDSPSNDDWIDLPKSVLKSLKSNEN